MNSIPLSLIESRLPDDLSLIASTLIRIASNPSVRDEFPWITNHINIFKEALYRDNTEDIEDALLSLYINLHKAGSVYTEEERQRLRSKGGYLCYPGGLSPLRLARGFITKETVIADLGSGNGLQGLLLQELYPHRKTIQIEISKEMIRIGKLYQEALGISNEKVEWFNGDIIDAPFEEADLIYIYRPARPADGADLYRNIADRLSRQDKEVTIFSVADCLAPFLEERFTTHYDDGHLKIFVNYEVSS